MGFGGKTGNSVSALRTQVGVGLASAKPAARPQQPDLRPPPPRPKAKDMADEQAERAEKMAQLQHETSLLTRGPKNNRTKEYKEKKKGGLVLQILLVIIVAGGVAVALDPQLLAQVTAMVDWEALKAKVGLN